MVRPVAKEVKRYDHNGEMVNFGQLVMGSFNGIECLSHRESILVMGGTLIKKKPPEQFMTSAVLSVPVNDRMKAKVYALDPDQLGRLAHYLSSSLCGKVYVVATSEEGPVLKVWENGTLIYGFKQRTVTKPAKVSGLGRFWLLLKRLFSTEKENLT